MRIFKLNSANSFILYQVGRFGTSILINIVLAKSNLTISKLGEFESFIFYSSVFSFFWLTGISQGFLSLFKENEDGKKSVLSFNMFILIFILSSILFFLFILINCLNLNLIIPGLSKKDIFLLSIYILIYPSSFCIEYIILVNKKYKSLVLYAVLSSFMTILFVPLPALWGLSIEYCIYGLIIVSTLKILYLIILLKKYAVIEFRWNSISDLFKISLPLIGSALVAGSATYIDGIIVSQNFDSGTFALFRYGAREIPLFLLISSAFSTSMIPLFSNNPELFESLEFIKKKSKQFIRYFFPLAITLLIFSQYLFQYIFNKNLRDSYKVFDIFLLLIISRFIFPGTILMGLKKNNIVLIVSIVELVINITASLLFISIFGYLGVAYGTILAYYSEKVLLSFFVTKKCKISVHRYIPVKQLLIFSSILILSYCIKQVIS